MKTKLQVQEAKMLILQKHIMTRRRRLLCVAPWLALALSMAVPSQAQSSPSLSVVKPVLDCAALTQISLRQATGVEVTLQADTVETPKGAFCRVMGVIAPSIHMEIDLPEARWTQRFLQAGCGGLCGMINASIGNAGTCRPALDGEFAVAATDMGHQAQMGAPGEGDFAADPQKRIDFAYRANHLTALAAKALIKAYYGQPERYAYFSGCSDGGREALMEAQRFPDDFDGISAGAPAFYFQVQNSLNHAWTTAVNTRPDGSTILERSKLDVLHKAVIEHCDALDGVKDGLLSDPRACKVNPAWVLCTEGSSEQTECLTAEEWTAASRLYSGPTDGQGRFYMPGGWQPGSELQWGGGGFGPRPGPALANTGQGTAGPAVAQARGPGAGMLVSMAPVVFPTSQPGDTIAAGYPFTMAQFQRALQLHGLNDATNTNLGPFRNHGGKLILYHGWSDTSIAPMTTVAYYTAVQHTLGVSKTDEFIRLFMVPGMGHCGGGDGFSQIDTLAALMAWVEQGEAPTELIADRIPPRQGMPGGGNGPDGRGGRRQTAPFANPNQPALASRPLYPFPQIPHLDENADPNVASSYHPGASDVPDPAIRPWVGSDLLDNKALPSYTVQRGKLTEIP